MAISCGLIQTPFHFQLYCNTLVNNDWITVTTTLFNYTVQSFPEAYIIILVL